MADGSPTLVLLDIRQIADAICVHKSAAEKRANKQAWEFSEQTGRGGRRRLYNLASLPADVQQAIARHQAIQAANQLQNSPSHKAGEHIARKQMISESIDAKVQQRLTETGAKNAVAITGSKKQRMEARLDILARLDVFANQRRIGICNAMQDFCKAYSTGDLQVPVSVRNFVGPDLCPMTLRRWRKTLKQQGAAALAGEYGNRTGTSIIETNENMRDLVIGLMAAKPHISAKLVYQSIEVRFSDSLPSARTVARFMDKWKHDNHEAFTAVSNPDAWKNKYKAALGKLDEDVVRINQRWAVDSTPGDIQLVDGRYNILGAIDLATRRVILHVSKNSTAEAVSMLLRKCILKWGVPEQIKMDNGKDYASDRVQRNLLALQIQACFSQKFSPWEKGNVERMFRSFSHGLFELLPGFAGHNVAEAQSLRAKESFADRMYTKNKSTEIKITAAELQSFCDKWTEHVHAHAPHQGLEGKTPFQRTAEMRGHLRTIDDVRALDLLLADVPDNNGIRTVSKKGIKVEGRFYISAELATVIGQSVQCFYHEDLGTLVVYHNEAFLCIAECPEIAGISRKEVAVEATLKQNKAVSEKRRELKVLARKANTNEIVNEILERKAEEASRLTAFPSPNIVHLTPALEAARDAADALDAATPPAMRPTSIADLEQVRDLRVSEMQQDETAAQRFRRAIDLLMKPEDERNDFDAYFLKNHSTSAEFLGRWDMFESFGPACVGLDESHEVLLPDGAFYYRYLKLKTEGEN